MKCNRITIIICSLLITTASAIPALAESSGYTSTEKQNDTCIEPYYPSTIHYIIQNTTTEEELPQRTILTTHENLAPNPSFELGCCIMPAGWTYSIDNQSKFHWDSKLSHSGAKSIGTLNLTETTRWSRWEITDMIPVDLINNIYEFSGWYKFIGTPIQEHYAAFVLLLYDQEINYLGGFGTLYNFSSEWKYISTLTSEYNDSLLNATAYVKLSLYQYYIKNPPDPFLEVRFDDVYFGFGNEPPNTPTITGETNGEKKTAYNYTISTTDPNQDNVQYYIDWGDNTFTLTAFSPAGNTLIVPHKWDTKGSYNITIKAIDEHYAESAWAILTVTMPYPYNPIQQFFGWLFARFPDIFSLFQQRIQS